MPSELEAPTRSCLSQTGSGPASNSFRTFFVRLGVVASQEDRSCRARRLTNVFPKPKDSFTDTSAKLIYQCSSLSILQTVSWRSERLAYRSCLPHTPWNIIQASARWITNSNPNLTSRTRTTKTRGTTIAVRRVWGRKKRSRAKIPKKSCV